MAERQTQPIHIIGGGLAGSEAAWQITRAGVPVVLHEMRPLRMTDAHKTDGLAELVCSNSFRSDDRETNAVGLLHEELRRADSLIMRMGDAHQVPAGGALAVDREGFAGAVTEALASHKLVMAERGRETLRHGPMKPFGLTNPRKPDEKPYAVVQLRQDNALGTLYNMVGFQTKLKYAEQVRIFRMIPGLQNAEFARLGGLHRNTFLNSPRLLDGELRLKAEPRLRFAGQITGCEGYVESAAVGLLAGRAAAAQRLGQKPIPPPATTALGALLSHITGGHLSAEGEGARSFQPMNVNFGLFPPITAQPHPGGKGPRSPRGFDRKRALARRALADLDRW